MINIAKELLIVYNSNAGIAADSLEVCNYLLDSISELGGHTTPVPQVLACNVPPGNSWDQVKSDENGLLPHPTYTPDYENSVRTPIYNAYLANKQIKYIILIYGMPFRTISSGSNSSVQYRLTRALAEIANPGIQLGSSFYSNSAATSYSGNQTSLVHFNRTIHTDTSFLSTSITANTKADAKAYIDKIAAVRNAMATPGPVISPFVYNPNRKNFFDLAGDPSTGAVTLPETINPLVANNINATYEKIGPTGSDRFADNPLIASVMWDWGYYSYGQNINYQIDGSITYHTNNNWVFYLTGPSYGGMLTGNGVQNGLNTTFAATAFGGSSYANTPVLFIGSCDEPGVNPARGVGVSAWDNGFIGIESAWLTSRNQETHIVGYPFVALYYNTLARITKVVYDKKKCRYCVASIDSNGQVVTNYGYLSSIELNPKDLAIAPDFTYFNQQPY